MGTCCATGYHEIDAKNGVKITNKSSVDIEYYYTDGFFGSFYGIMFRHLITRLKDINKIDFPYDTCYFTDPKTNTRYYGRFLIKESGSHVGKKWIVDDNPFYHRVKFINMSSRPITVFHQTRDVNSPRVVLPNTEVNLKRCLKFRTDSEVIICPDLMSSVVADGIKCTVHHDRFEHKNIVVMIIEE